MKDSMNALIITGGSIEVSFAKAYIQGQEWNFVISADSGMEFCREAEILPDMILGDFDSAAPDTLKLFQERCPERILKFPAEKDETDTELAIMKAIEMGADHITILGGTGSRLDHVLGNIHLLKMGMDAGVECCIVDRYNRIRMIQTSLEMQKKEQFGEYISLIPFTPQVDGLTLSGFAYEVKDFTLTSGKARGVSNEIVADTGRIDLKDGILLVIESVD